MLGLLFEWILYEDMFAYDEKGNLKGSMKFKPPAPKRLDWDFKEDLVKNIDQAYVDAKAIAEVNYNKIN